MAARLILFDGAFRVLFIGSHLAAHTERVADRNADFHRICAGLFNSKQAVSPRPTVDGAGPSVGDDATAAALCATATMVIEEHELVLWLGDLNYRMERS